MKRPYLTDPSLPGANPQHRAAVSIALGVTKAALSGRGLAWLKLQPLCFLQLLQQQPLIQKSSQLTQRQLLQEMQVFQLQFALKLHQLQGIH